MSEQPNALRTTPLPTPQSYHSQMNLTLSSLLLHSRPLIRFRNQPTNRPSTQPTGQPTNRPTDLPTDQPTIQIHMLAALHLQMGRPPSSSPTTTPATARKQHCRETQMSIQNPSTHVTLTRVNCQTLPSQLYFILYLSLLLEFNSGRFPPPLPPR